MVTTWRTPTGWIEVRDALTIGPRDHEDEVTPHTRPPADDDADHMLVRTVALRRGPASRSSWCASRASTTGASRRRGSWSTAAATPRTRPAPARRFRLASDLALGVEADRVRARHVLQAGEHGVLRAVLGRGAGRARRTSRRPRRGSARPSRFWRNWLGNARACPTTAGASRSSGRRWSIKGLTYMPTGATVAALTTSLPETPGGERNWDYRYTWMRDTTFTLQALHWLNLDWEADEFMQFVADLEPTEDGSLQIMYGIDGRRDLPESTRDDLSGYAGARPVRIGNGAFDQRQNDVFGAVLDSILLHTRKQPAAAAAAVADRAVAGGVRDQGLAEARPGHLGGARRAAALRLVQDHVLGRARPGGQAGRDPRATRAGRDVGGDGRGDPRRHARARRDATPACCASTTRPTRSTPRRCWPPTSASCPPDDERLRATVDAIAHDLTEDGFVLRYRTDETDDGLSGKEGTFLICSFWLVSALAVVGEMQQARDMMERLLRVASPLGPVRRGVRRGDRPAPGQLPAGVLAPGADRGRGADHRSPRCWSSTDGRATTSSSSAPAPAAGRWPGTWRRPASGSCCSSGATGCPASRRTGSRRTCSSTTATSRRTRGTTPRARRFQPQIHYYVGGATKLYGAALYRLRAGGLRRAAAPRRRLAGLADRLRRAGAVLHEGRAAVRGARRARRGSDRAAGERAVPVPGGRPRAADPAAVGRPGGGRLPPVPRPLRHPPARGQHGLQRVRPLHELRRLPLRRARQVGRRGARRPAGARASQRHAAGQRGRRPAGDGRRRRHGDRGRRHPRRRRGALPRRHRRGGLRRGEHRGAAPALGERPPSRTGWPTAPTRSDATTCSTTARRCSRCPASENPTVFQKTLGVNDFYFGSDDTEFPLGNIQMVGKSQSPMFRGEKPGETRFAPHWSLDEVARHAVDFWLSTEDLPRPGEPRHRRRRRAGSTLAYTANNDEPKRRLYGKLRSMLRQAGHARGPSAATGTRT